MNKRSFLLPLATSLTALVAGNASATALPVVPSMVPQTPGATSYQAPMEPLVIHRMNPQTAQYGHSSHGSHASHASHSSHYSSR